MSHPGWEKREVIGRLQRDLADLEQRSPDAQEERALFIEALLEAFSGGGRLAVHDETQFWHDLPGPGAIYQMTMRRRHLIACDTRWSQARQLTYEAISA